MLFGVFVLQILQKSKIMSDYAELCGLHSPPPNKKKAKMAKNGQQRPKKGELLPKVAKKRPKIAIKWQKMANNDRSC